MAFLAQSIEHALAVPRVARLERFAVQQLQRIQDRGALLALHAACDPSQRFLGRLIAVLPCDQDAEDRVLGTPVGEMRRQQRRTCRVDVVLDRRVRRQLAANDFQQALRSSLMHDFDGGRHMLAQPGRKRSQLIGRLVLVDFLVAARGGCSLFARASIEAQRAIKCGVAVFQLEEDLVCLLLVLEIRRVERLQEIEVEIAWRLRGRTLVGRPKEQIAAATGAPFPPLDLVFPDAVAGDVGRSIRVLENDAP